jgi:glutaminase
VARHATERGDRTAGGRFRAVYAAGDIDYPFTIMSVAKPSVFALVVKASARLMRSYGPLFVDPVATTELYTRQSSLDVNARDLAVMAATLADGGVNPLTKERLIDSEHCLHVLAVMTTARLYETSGDWLYRIGLPGKSGVGGGIITVAPGKAGMATFAPALDAAGNSVKGQLATEFWSTRLRLNLNAPKPAERA